MLHDVGRGPEIMMTPRRGPLIQLPSPLHLLLDQNTPLLSPCYRAHMPPSDRVSRSPQAIPVPSRSQLMHGTA